jgi:hypothetical protein
MKIMNLSEKIFVLILCVILVGELLLASYTLSVDNRPYVEIARYDSAEVGGNLQFKVTYSVDQPIYPLTIRIVIIPVYKEAIDKDIYVYYDEDYPSSCVTRAAWIGFVDHLLPTLKLKGYTGTVEIVNAAKLKEVMLNQKESIVIIPSGIFPATVHSKTETLVDKYLRNGGTIIWMGDGFAYYSGEFRENVIWPSEKNPGWVSQETILGYPLSGNYIPIKAYESSPVSNALNLQYPGIQTGVTISQALRNAGIVLGKVYDDKTSIGAVPVGKGSLIIFGGPVGMTLSEFGEDIVANDVANILLSNILQSNGQVSFNTIYRENITNDTIILSVSKDEFSGISFVVYSIDDYSYFFQRTYLPLK